MKPIRALCQLGLDWIELLETRVVLSAPPIFGNILAEITVAERAGMDYYSAGFARVELPVSDADTPLASLSFSFDSVTPLPPGVFNSMFFGGTISGPTLFYAPGDGPYQQTVNIRVTDNTGLSDTRSILFKVTNSAPDVTAHPYLASTMTSLVGQSAQFNAQARDAFYAGWDTLQAWWDFGDGVVTAPQTLTAWDHYGSGPGYYSFQPLAASHVFTRPGNFTVRVFVKDDDGAVTSRAFPSAVAVWGFGVDSAGILRIGGTSGNDNIHVSPAAGGKTNLFLWGTYQGAFNANSVVAYGNEGDDVLDCAPELTIPVEFHGGPGKDLLRGGAGNDLLFGEAGNDGLDSRAGNDILVGGDGNDIAFGGKGNDLLIGGLGSDSLYGEAGDDVLIAGYTSYDADPGLLSTTLGVWNLPLDYENRAGTLRYAFFNGTVYDGPATDADWLTGGTYGVTDRDYLWGSIVTTKFADRAGNEWIN